MKEKLTTPSEATQIDQQRARKKHERPPVHDADRRRLLETIWLDGGKQKDDNFQGEQKSVPRGPYMLLSPKTRGTHCARADLRQPE